MERECKNCGHMLYVGHTHCASCGAKWIQNRITMRNVASDFSDMYLGLDTKFGHTFIDLFRKPEAVINGYINGRRVYYMDAVRYLLVALFITGIYVFVIKQTNVMDQYMEESGLLDSMAFANMGPEEIERQTALSSTMMDYQGVFLLLTIPILAIAGRITFWGRKYFNFTEHVVFYLYTYGHMVVVTTPISILLIYVSPTIFYYWSFVGFLFMFLHSAYCYKRSFNLDTGTMILKSLISIIVMVVMIILFIIIAAVLFIAFILLAEKLGYDVSSLVPGQST
ncbi:hypothetical protein AAU57_14175 [Nonlabens sp. YIK11]|uniref:DUF3667 domain-containing protein n=1 Tax=Nonlabens sp. YIK11 TaxID=1453349 RepID=UPI0006DD108B|nr:DUF3667 domain-containing protein [Nonlabens sp. YIK11]KQC34357.1 hypothetical protein AAU57_14175 [Nonlabens sp. YIK11]